MRSCPNSTLRSRTKPSLDGKVVCVRMSKKEREGKVRKGGRGEGGGVLERVVQDKWRGFATNCGSAMGHWLRLCCWQAPASTVRNASDRSRLCQTSSRAIQCWASALAATLTGVCKHRAGRNQFALQPLFWDRAYLARDSPLALFTALPRGRAQSAIHSHPRTPPPD